MFANAQPILASSARDFLSNNDPAHPEIDAILAASAQRAARQNLPYAGHVSPLGRVTIGRGSLIGGNVWLTHSVPPRSTVTQAVSQNKISEDGIGL